METAAGNQQRRSRTNWLALVLVLGCVGGWLYASVPVMEGQSSSTQPPQNPAQNQSQNNDIPDAPTVQPPSETPEPPPIAKPEEKKPVERDPWTNQPINKPAAAAPAAAPGEATSAPPPMPPVKTVPPGSSTKPGPSSQDQLYTLVVHTNFVQVPVTVKDKQGRRVDISEQRHSGCPHSATAFGDARAAAHCQAGRKKTSREGSVDQPAD